MLRLKKLLAIQTSGRTILYLNSNHKYQLNAQIHYLNVQIHDFNLSNKSLKYQT